MLSSLVAKSSSHITLHKNKTKKNKKKYTKAITLLSHSQFFFNSAWTRQCFDCKCSSSGIGKGVNTPVLTDNLQIE